MHDEHMGAKISREIRNGCMWWTLRGPGAKCVEAVPAVRACGEGTVLSGDDRHAGFESLRVCSSFVLIVVHCPSDNARPPN